MSGTNDTDGITAKMVESIGDDDHLTPSAPPPLSPYTPENLPEQQPCADCKKQLGVLRAALIVLALVLGLMVMAYLAQRRLHGHGKDDHKDSDTATNE